MRTEIAMARSVLLMFAMDALLQVLRYRVARSIAPMSDAEYSAFLASARFVSLEDQERMSVAVLDLAFKTRRRWGARTEPLFAQLVDASDALIGAGEAA